MSIFGDVAGIFTAGRAGAAISNSDIAAEHGAINATQQGQAGIAAATGAANTNVNAAGQNINTATGNANTTLQSYLNGIQGNLAPSIASGNQGNTSLQAYAGSNPQFQFDPSTYLNSDAMKFQMQQGTNAITNAASVGGFGSNTLKDLTQYGQGLASTYYNQAETQAQNQFQLNQNTTLQNLQALIGAGNTGNSLNNQAVSSLGAPQASNTIGAASQNASLQQYLASLGVQGAESSAGLGLQGAQLAGNYAVGAGTARAAGITGTASAIGNTAGDLGSVIAGIPGVSSGVGGVLRGL